MKIKDVRASVHRLPIYLPGIDEPTEHRHHVFCEVETDEGHVGYGMTARFLTRAVASALTHDILPAVRDMDPRDLEAVHARVGRVVSERGLMNGVNLAAGRSSTWPTLPTRPPSPASSRRRWHILGRRRPSSTMPRCASARRSTR